MSVHDKLKELAKERLIKEGYAPNEIKYEYRIKAPSGKQYVVDVVAFKNKKMHTIVECGAISPIKLAALKTLFPRVIHIPYEGYENEIATQLLLIKELTDKNLELCHENQDLNAQGIYNKGLLIQIPDPVVQTDPQLIRLFIEGKKRVAKA